MTTFKDSAGTEWTLKLSTGVIEDITEVTHVDLDGLVKNPSKFADIILTEPKKLVEILYVLCAEQLETTGLTPRDFGRRFDRATLDEATNALLREVVTFYPRTSAGKVLSEKLPELLAKMDRDIEKKTTEEIRKVLLS